jgi:small-conductance mechanosensitive channel/CRP-like cAMP-binding protein
LVVALALVLAAATYVALIAAAQVLRRSRGIRFGRAYHPFALAVAALCAAAYAPRLAGYPVAWVADVLPHLTAVAILLGAVPAVTLVNRLLWVRTGPDGKPIEAPRVLADTTGIVVFVAVALAVLQFVYQLKVPGLVAGSGVVAIILGLAMQDLLGNIFGGLSLYLEKPFKPGDWLVVEGRDARVVEITWRSTRLVTHDDILIDVPNALICKNVITNFQTPHPSHALHAFVRVPLDVPPARVQALLRDSTASVPGVSTFPAPEIRLDEFLDSGIRYDVKFWIEDHRIAQRALSDVRIHAWYAIRRAGMDIPVPILSVRRARTKEVPGAARLVTRQALREHEILSFLGDAEIDRLVEESFVVTFAPFEHVIDQGTSGDSMFLIVRGRVEVRVAHADRTDVVARFGPGESFGEMSLLTGEPRSATIVALEELEAVEVTRDTLTPIIHANPEVLHKLSELLTERQAANEQHAAHVVPAHEKRARQASMLDRLQRFFFLGR